MLTIHSSAGRLSKYVVYQVPYTISSEATEVSHLYTVYETDTICILTIERPSLT